MTISPSMGKVPSLRMSIIAGPLLFQMVSCLNAQKNFPPFISRSHWNGHERCDLIIKSKFTNWCALKVMKHPAYLTTETSQYIDNLCSCMFLIMPYYCLHKRRTRNYYASYQPQKISCFISVVNVFLALQI